MQFVSEYKSNSQQPFKVEKNRAHANENFHRVHAFDPQLNNDTVFRSIDSDSWCPCDGACPRCVNAKKHDNVIQTKLKVSKPDDAYEQEADRLADQAMRIPSSNKLAKHEEEQNLKIGRKLSTTIVKPQTSDTVTNEFTGVCSSGGSPVDKDIKKLMESSFDYDFTNVRIHRDSKAAELARSVNAHAFTVGQDIVFGDRQYSPSTVSGQRMLAHELVHVMQQNTKVISGVIQRQSRTTPLGVELSTHTPSSAAKPRRVVKPKIVEIVAFEWSKYEAKAKIETTDGFKEVAITLISNQFPPGYYRLKHVKGPDYTLDISTAKIVNKDKNVSMTDISHAGFMWWNRRGFGQAEEISVIVNPGRTRRDLEEDISKLHPYIRRALTSADGAPTASKEDLEDILDAGLLLEKFDITEENLLLENKEIETGIEAAGSRPLEVSPKEWANSIIERKQKIVQKSESNKNTIKEMMDKLERLPAAFKSELARTLDMKRPPLEVRLLLKEKGEPTESEEKFEKRKWHQASDLLALNLLDPTHAIEAFDAELRSVTETFLISGLGAIARVESMYLAGKNEGAEEQRLIEAGNLINQAEADRDIAKSDYESAVQNLDRFISSVENFADYSRGGKKLEELKEKVENAEGFAELQYARYEEIVSMLLPLARVPKFDKESILGGKTGEDRRKALDDFVYHARRKIKIAQKEVTENKNSIYSADYMIALAEMGAGIEGNSLLDKIIRQHAVVQQYDTSLWETILNIISFALLIIPGGGPILGLLRAAATVYDMSRATKSIIDSADMAATGYLFHDLGMRSDTPSVKPIFYAVGGAILSVASAKNLMDYRPVPKLDLDAPPEPSGSILPSNVAGERTDPHDVFDIETRADPKTGNQVIVAKHKPSGVTLEARQDPISGTVWVYDSNQQAIGTVIDNKFYPKLSVPSPAAASPYSGTAGSPVTTPTLSLPESPAPPAPMLPAAKSPAEAEAELSTTTKSAASSSKGYSERQEKLHELQRQQQEQQPAGKGGAAAAGAGASGAATGAAADPKHGTGRTVQANSLTLAAEIKNKSVLGFMKNILLGSQNTQTGAMELNLLMRTVSSELDLCVKKNLVSMSMRKKDTGFCSRRMGIVLMKMEKCLVGEKMEISEHFNRIGEWM